MRTEAAGVFLAVAAIFTPGPAPAESVRLLVQSSPLAGFQYYAGATLWNEMKAGDRLVLVREPDNAHDPRAVRVEWRGRKLGYLPRAENAAVATEMDRGALVEGRISRLVAHRNPWRRLRVDVWLVAP
ncbi:MAG TPA: HIRAN protein [Rhodocyclaceae bacterium]|nr:MAG: HIRAN protein [Betaproteobacteria bacterium CG2_30_68_42]PIV71747.1 MAG: HIRAN protein [Rhodocyclales bacterium CG17_big_fil_post_rev_8_21_14_2_50_68_7]PIX74805.1 MAG: HIRAN protein [Rhodocyclales bacterium CG_4_10_14_3_um_filter_68_10]PJA57173.1 MAG: HIRAN protein [Rhodocyclales bacterium CG_4_9_14_3_um_filter_68_10]HCX33586.1 HIRAN protein [Rhodocyclaceae bacterium]